MRPVSQDIAGDHAFMPAVKRVKGFTLHIKIKKLQFDVPLDFHKRRLMREKIVYTARGLLNIASEM